MDKKEVRETLEKQLQLLSKRSEECSSFVDIEKLTSAMCALVYCLNLMKFYQ